MKKEANKKTLTIVAECSACDGSGIYLDEREKGIGVICRECDGSGKRVIEYVPFKEKNVRKDIKVVRWAKWHFRNFDEWKAGGEISYEDYLAGKKLPPLPSRKD